MNSSYQNRMSEQPDGVGDDLYNELEGLDKVLFSESGPVMNEEAAPLWERRSELCRELYPSHCWY